MYQDVEYRLCIQSANGNDIYYPRVISAETTESYPLQVPTANIKVTTDTNQSSPGAISEIRFDDIARLQVSTRRKRGEKKVWQDVFGGRVRSLENTYGSGKTFTLFCSGHLEEAVKVVNTASTSYAGAYAAWGIIETNIQNNLTRITIPPAERFAEFIDNTVVSVSDYVLKPYSMYIHDILSDMEKLSGYQYIIRACPIYDANGLLSTAYIYWKPFSTTVTSAYAAIEKTTPFISADLKINGENFITQFVQMGATPEGGSQYAGAAVDSTLVSRYGSWTDVETETWIPSNSLCNQIAANILDDRSKLNVSGTVTILGAPDAHIGDLMYLKSPSSELNGASIEGNYNIYGVSHSMAGNMFTTKLTIGNVVKTAYDYINDTAKLVRKLSGNFIS